MKSDKKPTFNLFLKTFLLTTAMLMGVTFIAFTLIYRLLPSFYQNHQLNVYQNKVNAQLVELSNASNIEEEFAILHQLFDPGNTPFSLRDENGVLLQPPREDVLRQDVIFSVEYEWEDGYGDDTNHQGGVFLDQPQHLGWHVEMTNGGESVVRVLTLDQSSPHLAEFFSSSVDFAHAFLSLSFDYQTQDGALRTIEVSVPLYPLADAQIVIMSMYPFAIFLSVTFALLSALVFSRFIVRPIKKIQLATSKMRKLEPHIAIASASKDEIGILSRDISQLYEKLHGTIITLEQEIRRYSDSENKKIEFLQSVSHEMKTPLASANALLEGIIYEIPPYHNHPKRYLEECREFLQKTITLTKESLNLSEQYKKPAALENLADLIKETSNLYGVIFMIKQLSYYEDVPGNIPLHTKRHLFMKVLSNLFSNAANYTRLGGEVRVTYEDGVFMIFNSCTPLTDAEVDAIFKPLMTQNTSEHATGLGLFIVKQLLRQLKIDFSFAASPEQDGMVFSLYLQPHAQTSDTET